MSQKLNEFLKVQFFAKFKEKDDCTIKYTFNELLIKNSVKV